MTLTISLPPEVEEKLNQQAAASGRAAADYACTLIAKAVHSADAKTPVPSTKLPPPTPAAVDEFLKQIEQLKPDTKFPRLRGQEAEIEAMIVEKHYLNRRKR